MPAISDTTRSRLIGLLEQGATDRAIAAELGLDKNTPARYRHQLSIGRPILPPPPSRTTITIEQAWQANVRPLDGGHMQWTGRLNNAGVPTFSYRARPTSARVIAFRIRTGRDPVGYVKPECDAPGCVAPRCVDDRPGRENTARLLAELGGTR
ncbi:hypothetical protein [Streptomyces sp900116325]|uniref:hypothetical protein n=1 Tax=Streptomyces sp. 900116325 TaxID=3154295 RepID=UPI0033ACA758